MTRKQLMCAEAGDAIEVWTDLCRSAYSAVERALARPLKCCPARQCALRDDATLLLKLVRGALDKRLTALRRRARRLGVKP